MPNFSGSCAQKLLGQTIVAVADSAEHLIGVSVVVGNHKTEDALWDGSRCTSWGTMDIVDGKGKQSGYFRNEHQDGDASYGTFEAALTDGAMNGSGTWQFAGGTGKFAHITGNGVVTVKQTSPTDSDLEWSGSYNLG